MDAEWIPFRAPGSKAGHGGQLRNHPPCQHNWRVITNGSEMPAPQPIPDLTSVIPATGVTDEDRNRYGVLLDRAAERGLLSSAAYQVRLAEVADAASVEELQRIVTELPAFDGVGSRAAGVPASPGPVAVPGRPSGYSPDPATLPTTVAPELDAALWAGLTPVHSRRNKGNPWIILAVVVVILVVAMVGLALVAARVVHTQPGHAASTVAAELSLLRP
jgi:hypothetical protein